MADKYVFMDRDGVINKDGEGWTEHGYITRREDLIFLPGVPEAFKMFKEHGFKCVIISNQQGVGKGYFSGQELKSLTDGMMRSLEEHGGDVCGVYYCTHLKEENCSCRKPGTGLFDMAAKEMGIDMKKGVYYYVGDTERDIESGRKAGLRTILVLSGKTSEGEEENWKFRPDYIFKDLLDAAVFITGEGG